MGAALKKEQMLWYIYLQCVVCFHFMYIDYATFLKHKP